MTETHVATRRQDAAFVPMVAYLTGANMGFDLPLRWKPMHHSELRQKVYNRLREWNFNIGVACTDEELQLIDDLLGPHGYAVWRALLIKRGIVRQHD